MKLRRVVGLLASSVVALSAGCGGETPPGDAETAQSSAPAQTATLARTPSPAGARVFIISPINGETVSSPLEVKFGISGMAVAPAGDYAADSGHHHLLVDAELQDLSAPVPTSDNHLHFGKGQTETTLELSPGEHTLQLVLGDGNHIPHEPPVQSQRVTVTVQ